jgi:choline-glycine betaine transporter
MIDHALFAVAAVWMALTAPIVVMKDTINENLPAFVLTFIDTSQSYFLLSVALILFVLLYFQIKKFPDLK